MGKFKFYFSFISALHLLRSTAIAANGLGIGAVKPDLPKAKKGLSSILIGFHGTNPRVSHCTQAH